MLRASTILFLVLFGALCVSSCSFDLFDFDDECWTDSDCPAGYACISGWFGSSCEKRCHHHSDCPPSKYCTGCSEREPCDGYCETGCRSSTQCRETSWCNHGTCAVGCYSDTVCQNGRSNSVCVGDVPGSGPSGECRTSCTSSADCAKAEVKLCTCGACVAPCASDGTCSAGFVCVEEPGCAVQICRRG